MKNFAIYACFSRSFDQSHNRKNKIHLISSVVGGYDDFSLVQNYINRREEYSRYSAFNNINYIFMVVDKSDLINNFNKIDVDALVKNKNIFERSNGNVCLIVLTIDQLIGHLSFTNKNNELFENIFGSKDLKQKDFDLIYQHSLFIFYNMFWCNILMKFKVCDVHISGGCASRRHVLSSVEMQLNYFLNELYDYNIPQKIVYNVSKSIILSKTIPFEDNNKTGLQNKNIISTKDELAKLSLTIFNENKDNIFNNRGITIGSNLEKFVKENLLLSFDILQKGIITNYESKISKFNEFISLLKNDCSNLSYQIEKTEDIINNNRSSGMSSRQKKKFKEERNLIINDSNSIHNLTKMRVQIQNKLSQIEDLKINVNRTEEELVTFKNKFENMSIKELNVLYERISNDENKDYKYFKFKVRDNHNKNGMFTRSYSTTNYNRLDAPVTNNLSISNELAKPTYYLNESCCLEGAKSSLLDNSENNLNIKYDINNILYNKENSNTHIFINYLDDILQDSNLSPIEMQQKIESKWAENLLEKLDKIDNKARNSLSYIIKKANETLSLILESKKIKKRFPSFYDKLNKNHLIIAYSILTTFYDILGFTAIAMKIANDILYEIYSKEWKDYIQNNEPYITFNNYILSKDINEVVKLKLGSFFIEIFCRKPTYIFDRTYKFNNLDEDVNDSDLAILEINEEYFNFIKNNFILSPVSLPMLCKPNKWSNNEFGGYLENIYSKEEIITGSTNHKHSMENKQSLYEAINKLNSIKFSINTKLLNFLENEGFYILEHYFKYKLRDKTDKNQSIISLMVAKSLSKFNHPFYICTGADWRGRIYTKSFFITYQGGDLSNALVNFYEGMPLNESGKDYLYIYGANCYNVNNLSKKSFLERIEWVKENYDNIISLNKEFILKANNLFLFTSFCLIMKEIHNNPHSKVHMPIFLDATCSGIQHLAALIQDFESGMKVNLIPQNINDNVGDIYSDLIDPINKTINLFGENKLEYSEFKKIKLTRKHLKLPIMTKVYNVSVIGIADQLRNSFDKNVNKNKLTYYSVPTEDGFIKLTNREIYILAEIINKQIFISLPSLESIYNFFKEIVKLCLKCNIPLTWFTPSGLKITQYYAVSNQNKVSISFKSKSKSVILREVTNKIDNRKQINSIIPNIIHSLDASHLINIINNGLINVKFPDILTVHDCFGSHPNNIDQLKSLVISEFVKLYSNENFLKKLKERILLSLSDNNFEVLKDTYGKEYVKIKRTKIYIPELPQPGKLDYSKILLSQYLIN